MTATPNPPRPSSRHARRLMALALVGGLVAVAAACGGDDNGAADTTAPSTEAPTTTEPATTLPETTPPPTTPAPTTAAPTTTPPPIPRMPLTGVPLADGQTVPDRPALAVKIDNVECAHRTQVGLNLADVVFEEIVEGRLTRFAAVFHSQSSNPVGPVRSGRSQDVDMLGSLQRPLLAWSGGNAGVVNYINSSDLINLSAQSNAGGYYRGRNCAKPHNLWNNTDTLWAQAPAQAGRPIPLFQYIDPGAAMPGGPISFVNVKVGVNDVRWGWDPASATFLRWQNGSPHKLADGTQVSANSVVVLVTPYRLTPWDQHSPEAISVGQGDAYVFSNGTVQTGTWSRPDRLSGYTLTAPDGSPIKLAPGRTWIEMADVADHGTNYG
jgi:hypothetical protein